METVSKAAAQQPEHISHLKRRREPRESAAHLVEEPVALLVRHVSPQRPQADAQLLAVHQTVPVTVEILQRKVRGQILTFALQVTNSTGEHKEAQARAMCSWVFVGVGLGCVAP